MGNRLLVLNESSDIERTNRISDWANQIQIRKAFVVIFIAFLTVVSVGEIFTEAYYRSKEADLIDTPDFEVSFPEKAPYYQEDEFSEITKTILKYNEGRAASWEGTSGNHWRIYLLEWEPKRVSKKLVSAHTPEVCYPAAGYKLHSYLGINSVVSNGVPLNFRTYLFKEGDNYFYVFHAVWEEKVSAFEDYLETEALSQKERLASVAEGKRNLGQKILGVSVIGPKTLEDAKQALINTLSTIIVPTDA